MVATLSGAIESAIAGARFPERGIFLELFGGTGPVTRALRRFGFAAVSIDLTRDKIDVCNPRVVQYIKRLIDNNVVGGIMFETPCSSWSNACRPMIRSRSHIWGFDNLTSTQRSKVHLGNLTLRRTIYLIKACIAARVPVCLENPQSSLMWHAPGMNALLRSPSAHTHTVCMCAYGARWRKATTIASWCSDMRDLSQHMCHGRRGMCDYSRGRHIQLSGRDPAGVLWTSIASVYPKKLAQQLATLLAVNAVRK